MIRLKENKGICTILFLRKIRLKSLPNFLVKFFLQLSLCTRQEVRHPQIRTYHNLATNSTYPLWFLGVSNVIINDFICLQRLCRRYHICLVSLLNFHYYIAIIVHGTATCIVKIMLICISKIPSRSGPAQMTSALITIRIIIGRFTVPGNSRSYRFRSKTVTISVALLWFKFISAQKL